jgi:hypothetical protein
MFHEIEISVGDLMAFFIGFLGGFVWELIQSDTTEGQSQRMLMTLHERTEPEQEFWQPEEEEFEDVYLVSEAEYEATPAARHAIA